MPCVLMQTSRNTNVMLMLFWHSINTMLVLFWRNINAMLMRFWLGINGVLMRFGCGGRMLRLFHRLHVLGGHIRHIMMLMIHSRFGLS
jgi:hypothetical protein